MYRHWSTGNERQTMTRPSILFSAFFLVKKLSLTTLCTSCLDLATYRTGSFSVCAQGLIDEETRDSLNLPVYIPSVKEVTEAAESTDAFHIKRVELRGDVPYFPEGEIKRLLSDPEAFAKYYRTFNHSLMGSLVQGHVGKELAHKYFDRLEQNAATAARNNMVQELSFDNMLGIFTRK